MTHNQTGRKLQSYHDFRFIPSHAGGLAGYVVDIVTAATNLSAEDAVVSGAKKGSDPNS